MNVEKRRVFAQSTPGRGGIFRKKPIARLRAEHFGMEAPGGKGPFFHFQSENPIQRRIWADMPHPAPADMAATPKILTTRLSGGSL